MAIHSAEPHKDPGLPHLGRSERYGNQAHRLLPAHLQRSGDTHDNTTTTVSDLLEIIVTLVADGYGKHRVKLRDLDNYETDFEIRVHPERNVVALEAE